MSDKRFATLDSLKADGGGGGGGGGSGSGSDDGSGDESRRGQEFYVGGSEHSGQQVVGPPRDRRPAGENAQRDELIDALTRQAQAQGDGDAGGPTGDPADKVTVVLKLWSNGFSLDEGELRPYDTPGNKTFMGSIMRGRVPEELTQQHRTSNVDVKLEMHRDEQYRPPPMRPFTGGGRRLGGVVPNVAGAGALPAAAPPEHAAGHVAAGGPSSCSSAAAAATGHSELPVDEAAPMGRVQIRLMNNKRLVTRVNPARHTVEDLRRLVVDNYAEYEYEPFVLMATFPNRVLTDEKATIEAAGLNNAVVQQKKAD